MIGVGRMYLAGRYSRRLELCGYRDILRGLGIVVQARWLDGMHQLDNAGNPIGDNGERLVEDPIPRGRSGELMDSDGNTDEQRAAVLRTKFALDDYIDCMTADAMVAFTEPPRSAPNRGGRHVELGIGLARNIPVVVVGHRENIFCWLPQVVFYPTWQDYLTDIQITDSLPGVPQ